MNDSWIKSSTHPNIWRGCYADNWNGLIVPEAFQHPAKFAPGQIGVLKVGKPGAEDFRAGGDK